MKTIKSFFKKEIVLIVAWVLALLSMFFVHPSAAYLDYIDFRSLGILWCLMVIMQGYSKDGVFKRIGSKLLGITKSTRELVLVLVGLCFFFSMFITNDVALITFVPFAILLLKEINRKDLLIPVVVLQTVAANLGSMMTPVGNPQNLCLYGLMDMSIGHFLLLLLPYTAASFVMLLVCVFLLRGNTKISCEVECAPEKLSPFRMILFSGLFVVALLTVLRFIPYQVTVLLVLIFMLIFEREAIKKVDYALLFTFVGFFIFTGNMGHIDVIKDWLSGIVAGNEVIVGVLASQVISNVPAALLLSGFSSDLSSLTIGVDLGGLGTLIASMASLISYKFYAAEDCSEKGKYVLFFTVINIVFLVVLLGLTKTMPGIAS